jgi:hypothetical protein
MQGLMDLKKHSDSGGSVPSEDGEQGSHWTQIPVGRGSQTMASSAAFIFISAVILFLFFFLIHTL